MKKSLLKITKGDLRRVLLHIPVGLATVFLGYFVGWWLAVIFDTSFIVYELNQDWHISDMAFVDIKGHCWGLFLGGVILSVLKILGIVI